MSQKSTNTELSFTTETVCDCGFPVTACNKTKHNYGHVCVLYNCKAFQVINGGMGYCGCEQIQGNYICPFNSN